MLSERLKKGLSMNELTWQKCAELADIPSETMRNIYYGKVKDPKVSTMLSLSRVLHVSVNWLMGVDMLPSDETGLLDNYRMCGVHGKSILQQLARYEAYTARDEREADGKHAVPCIMPHNLCCEGARCANNEMKEVYTNVPEAFMGLLVPNNQWSPRYCKGDIILLKDQFPQHGEEALFTYQDHVYFRKYYEGDQEHILRCINNRHQDLVFQRMDSASLVCIGSAIGVVKA